MTLLTFGSLTVSLALAAALTAAPLVAADQDNAATAAAGEKKTEEPARSGARLSSMLKVGGTARQTSTAKAQDQECKEVCSLANRHDHRDVFKLEPKK